MSEFVMSLRDALTPVSISGSSAQSEVLGSDATTGSGVEVIYVRVVATTDTHIVEGANPTATTNDTLLIANQPERIRVTRGNKIAGIQNASAGTLYITPLV